MPGVNQRPNITGQSPLKRLSPGTYQGEKMPADFSDKLSAGMQQGIEPGMHETREALAKKDAELAMQRAAALAEM
jgi:hypothetical protein